MSNQKKFGVWLDTHHATVVGNNGSDTEPYTVIATIKGEDTTQNSSEKSAHNQEKMILAKFFKEIASHLVNATHVHVTGTGQVQEQFIHYLADTPQFKNTKTEESTSNKMSEDKLVEFLTAHLQ
jgi:stalled ribosome rescue protein Dom34